MITKIVIGTDPPEYGVSVTPDEAKEYAKVLAKATRIHAGQNNHAVDVSVGENSSIKGPLETYYADFIDANWMEILFSLPVKQEDTEMSERDQDEADTEAIGEDW
jgi:hypothetical protein